MHARTPFQTCVAALVSIPLLLSVVSQDARAYTAYNILLPVRSNGKYELPFEMLTTPFAAKKQAVST